MPNFTVSVLLMVYTLYPFRLFLKSRSVRVGFPRLALSHPYLLATIFWLLVPLIGGVWYLLLGHDAMGYEGLVLALGIFAFPFVFAFCEFVEYATRGTAQKQGD